MCQKEGSLNYFINGTVPSIIKVCTKCKSLPPREIYRKYYANQRIINNPNMNLSIED
jgi:hypothetical protein